MSYSNSNAQWRQYLLKTLGMVVMVNTILLPKTEMILRDHVSKTIGKVDNIPLAFAVPVGIIENFGQIITIGFEQVFAPIEQAVNPNSPVFSYYNYGMLFGARLKKEVSQQRIKSPEFVGNMQNFIRQCVIIPAMIGHQFTKEELLSTHDMWGLVSKKAGTLVRLDMTVGKSRTTMTCKEAVSYFEESWRDENTRIFTKYSDTDFGKARTSSNYGAPANGLSKVFENNIKTLYGGVESAGNILRQQMMINSISDYRSSKYGVARARMQQESSSILSSDLASLYLPMTLVVFKCVMYSAFIFLVPMLLFSGGMSKYTSYLTLVASLQLWPSINAVINMIIGTYSNLKLGSGMLVSFSTTSTIDNYVDTIVTIAGGLQIVVPFLAYWMTNLGASGLTHLAGNIIGGTQSVAGAVGGEMATGNRSMDNINENNSQRNMHNANKTDGNMQYFAGVNSTQMSDGGIKRINPDGSEVFSGGAGATTSTGSRQFTDETGLQNQLSQGTQQSDAMLASDRRSFSDAKSQTFSKTADYVAHLAQREHNGESFNYDSMGEQGKSLRQAVNNTKILNERNGYGFQQNAATELEAHIKGSTPLAGLTGVDIGGGVTGSISADNSSEQSAGNENSINRENHIDNSYSNVVRAATNSSWAKENSIDNSYSDGIRNSYNEEKRLEQQLSKSQERSDNYHEAQTRLGTQGATLRVDRYDDVMNELVKGGHARSKEDARNLIEEGSPIVDKTWNDMSNRKLGGIMQNIESGKGRVTGERAVSELNNFTNETSGQIKKDSTEELLKAMDENGFDTKSTRANIAAQEARLKTQHAGMTAENSTQYGAVKKYNEMEEKRIEAKTDKYEEDRIGRGGVGTLGGLIEGVGGPNKYSDMDHDFSSKPSNTNIPQKKEKYNRIHDASNSNAVSKSSNGSVNPGAYEKALKNKLEDK